MMAHPHPSVCGHLFTNGRDGPEIRWRHLSRLYKYSIKYIDVSLSSRALAEQLQVLPPCCATFVMS